MCIRLKSPLLAVKCHFFNSNQPPHSHACTKMKYFGFGSSFFMYGGGANHLGEDFYFSPKLPINGTLRIKFITLCSSVITILTTRTAFEV